MPGSESCQPCCATSTTVNVPGVAGADGAAGAAGAPGINAFTILTADFTIPAVGVSDTITVQNSQWMVVGQKIYIGEAGLGGAYFDVAAVPTTTTASVTTLGYEDDIAPGLAFTAANLPGVSPGGTQPDAITSSRLSVYAEGTPYDLTAGGYAALTFGTTSPSLALTEDGIWMISARVRLDYFYATYAADIWQQDCYFRLYETSAPAAIADSVMQFKLRDVTTAYFTAQVANLPVVFYDTTAGVLTRVVRLEGYADVLPTTGSLRCYEAEITAVKVAESP